MARAVVLLSRKMVSPADILEAAVIPDAGFFLNLAVKPFIEVDIRKFSGVMAMAPPCVRMSSCLVFKCLQIITDGYF